VDILSESEKSWHVEVARRLTLRQSKSGRHIT